MYIWYYMYVGNEIKNKKGKNMKTMTREFYIPKGSKEIKAAKTDAVAYISDYEDGTKYTAMVFGGKRSAYDKYYGFKTKEARDEYVIKYFTDQENAALAKNKWAADKKAQAEENQKSYQVGDILVSSWGYDQTNIDYYQVIERTAKMATIQKIGKECLDSGYPSEEKVMPAKDAFVGKPKKKKVGTYGITISSYETASLWDGKPDYQTAYGWGH